MKKRDSLVHHILLENVLISVGCFLIATVIACYLIYQASLNSRLAELQQISAAMSSEISSLLGQNQKTLTSIANVIETYYDLHDGQSQPRERERIYRGILKPNPTYINIYDAVPRESGMMAATADLPENYTPFQREWYQKAMRHIGQVIFSGPYIDAKTHEICITYSRTIASNSGRHGVVAIDISLEKLINSVLNLNPTTSTSTRFFIVDSDGNIILHPDPAMRPQQATHRVLFRKYAPEQLRYLKDYGKVQQFPGLSQEMRYFISYPLEGTNWYIISTTSVVEVARPIYNFIAIFALLFVISMGLSIYVQRLRLVRFLEKPILTLARHVEHIEANAPDPVINPHAFYGEFRSLAQSLSDMGKLRHIANHDALSGLYNRATFFEFAQKNFALSCRSDHKASALMIDIDFFKKVNDNYGHETGDKVIAEFAKALRTRLRKTDFCGRYGGEEFVVWMPETPIAGARIAAEDLRKTVEKLRFTSTEGKIFGITISIGVAHMEDNAPTLETVIHCADIALYDAKRQGRNQVCLFQSAEEAPPPAHA
ncbi:MAG: diguanylate cyclase [Zoogloeaceae bacterium]|nr:diguanylate cyclase [Zoogloeaceae bacterium]